MKRKSESQPPVSIRRGRVAHAEYQDSLIPAYQGNPLIEGLPEILSKEESIRLLACRPQYDRQQCLLPTHLRLHLLQSVTKLFIPSGTILRLEQQISVMIRSGLVDRNPRRPGFWGSLEQRVETMKSSSITIPEEDDDGNLKAIGLTVVGISGIGKSTAIERILMKLYPQVIIHTFYKGMRLTYVQMVYLHIDCPSNGSLKALCLYIVQAFDDILGENYYSYYGCESRTAETLIPTIARIASLHSLGLLVIDEIQNLSEARSGGDDIMLNFFVKLINDIGVSVILVGTYKAMDVLGGKLRQARRGSGPSDLVWKPMENDEAWHRLIKALWKYQFLANASYEPDIKLIDLLHYECQGITDIGIKLFLLSQIRVMTTAKSTEGETITTSVIKSVAKDSLELVRPMLNALKVARKTNDWTKLKKFEDVYIDLEPYIEQAEKKLVEFSSSLDLEDILSEEETTEKASDSPSSSDSTRTPSEVLNNSNPSNSLSSRRSPRPVNKLQIVLQKAINQGTKRKLTAHQALLKAGHIVDSAEFDVV